MAVYLRDVTLAFLVVALGGIRAQAAGEWPVPRGPAREPAPYRLDAKTWSRVPKELREDAPAIILYSGTTHLIEDDGTVETITHEVTRLSGRKGIESLGEYHAIYFDPDYQKLILNEARVVKANGTVVLIEPKHVQLRDVATDYQVYDQDKQLVISFPNLEVGDTYEVKWTVRGKNPEFGGKFFSRYTFGDDTYPVVLDELHVVTSAKQPLKYAALNGAIDLKIGEHKGRKYYHWKVVNRPEPARDDDRPSKEEARLQVACSTFSSWAEVAQWKQKLRAECWKCLPQVKETVERLCKDLKTPLEKARALTYWVRRHIRYQSRGPTGTGYTPHLPHQVLANLFGDCKDQAQLLAVMLREAGMAPYLVTLGTLDDGQVIESVPSPWGTHAILMVVLDGKEHWIDTTVSQAAWDYLPRSDRDRLAYLTRDGELKLARTPPLTYADNKWEQTTHVTIHPDGTTTNRRTSTYYGATALARRDAWIEIPPGERRRLLSAELQDANQRTRLLSLKVDESVLTDFDKPVTAAFTYQIPKQFSGELSKEASLTDSQVWQRLLAYSLDPERQSPLHLGTPFESSHRFVVEAPLAFRFDTLPVDQEVRSRWGSFSMKVTAPAGKVRQLEIVMHTRLADVRVEPKDFSAFLQFHEDVSKAYRAWINLRPTQELADAPLLELQLGLAPWSDAVSAAVLAKLYLQQGYYDDARRILRRACYFHSHDRGLWDLRIKSARDLEEEERIYEDMARTFPRDAKIAVDLGAVRVKRGDYAGAHRVLGPVTVDKSDQIRGLAHYQLARAYFHENHPQAALKHLEAAGQSDPQALMDPDLLHFKASVHEKLDQKEEAMAAYRSVLALDPDALDSLDPLIRLEIKEGQGQSALDHLRHYTLAVGKDPVGLTRAAEFHLQMNRLEDALELANRGREAGNVAGTQRVLGLTYFRKADCRSLGGFGSLNKALFHLERADIDGAVLECLIQACLLQGDLPRAEHHYEAALSLADAPDTAAFGKTMEMMSALLTRSQLLWKQSGIAEDKKDRGMTAINHFLAADWAYRHNVAREQVTRYLADSFVDGIDFGPALALRGQLHLDKGNGKAALADAQRALRQKPQDARAYFVRGRVRLERGDAGAVSDLERAATLSNREDGTILHWLASALFEAGRRDDALTVQRRAVQLRPSDGDVAEQLRTFEKAGL